MKEGLAIGIDVGTQSVRALLTDQSGRNLACVRRATPTNRIDDNIAEYDPDALWGCVVDLLRELAQHISNGQTVVGISCASIGESCVLLGTDGEPLAPALAWFDRRTEPDGQYVSNTIGVDRLFQITGYPPDHTLTLCKLLWHRRTQPELFADVKMFLPISPWILFKLCGVAAVDPSLASRTLCLDVHSGTWSAELLDAFDLDFGLFPPIAPSATPLGPVLPHVLKQTGLRGSPIVSVGAQDHISGGFAAGVTRPEIFLDSLGTSEALLVTLDQPALTSHSRALGFVQTTVGLDTSFFLIGSGLNRSGGAIEWAFKTLAPDISREKLISEAMVEPPGSGGLIFVPNLAGSSAPHPHADDAGAFIGITEATRRGSLLRAVIEGVAMEAHFVSSALFDLPGVRRPDQFRLIGGGTRNPLLLEIKASVFGETLVVCDEPEMTAVGAAIVAGVGAGLWANFEEALGSARLPTHLVAPNPEWQSVYEGLFGSVYMGLRNGMRHVNDNLATFRHNVYGPGRVVESKGQRSSPNTR